MLGVKRNEPERPARKAENVDSLIPLETEAAVLEVMEALYQFILIEPELADLAATIVALPQETRNELLKELAVEHLEAEFNLGNNPGRPNLR